MAFSNTLNFDEEYYLSQNPDVAAAIAAGIVGSAEEHFNLFGFSEGRDPNPYFDTSYYLEQNPDVASAGINPLDHYNEHGETEGRSPNAVFDPAYYLEQNPDVAASGVSPFLHFINNGAGEGRAPNASVASQLGDGFDEAAYLAANPDIADAIAAGTFSSGYEHWLLFGFNESREGAQNTAGDIIQQPNNDGTPSNNPDQTPDQTPDETPDGGGGGGGGGGGAGGANPAVASLSGTTLELSFAPSGATLTTDGTNVTITGAGAAAATFALADFDTIDLNGLALEMSGDTVDQLFPDFNAGQIDVVGLGAGGGTLNITSVDFGDIEKETLKSPNLWLSDQNAASPVIAGFTFSELDGDQSILPDGVTVNGTVEDAFKAWWDSFDDFYAGGSNYYNTLINTQFVYLGNDYAAYLVAGGEAFLDIVKTSGDYTSRQQTLHDNLLGNLGDGAIQSRFGSDPADDPRTVDGQSFGGRGYASGNANTLVQFESAKTWDDTNGVNRADLDIEITADDSLSAIASDGATMWSGTGISNDDFRIVRNTDAQIELAIKAAERKRGDYPDSASTDLLDGSYYKNISPVGWDAPSWNAPGGVGDPENVARWSFNFSIAANYDGTAADSGEPTLADYEFQLVFDVDPTEGTSFVTYYLDDTDGGNWLFEGAEDANVAAAMNAILGGDLSNPIISDNVGENELDDPIYVAQNSQNYGFANSFEVLVNAFLGNAYNNDGSKIAGVNYWEAETHPGEFQIGLEAYSAGGADLLAENYITVGQDTALVSLKDGDGAGSVTWATDRRAVDQISTVSDPENGSNSVISFNIDETAEVSGFYRYQGAQIKSDDGNHFVDAAQGSSVSVDFYTDAAWNSDGEAQQTGVWVVTNYDDPATKAVENDRQYPIAEYLDADALAALAADPAAELINGTLATDVDLNGDTGLIRFWNSEVGWDDFVAVSLQGWNNLTFDLENNSHVWSLNDQEVYRYEGPLTQQVDVIETIIVNSVNHGEDQTYLFDNIEITGVSTDDYYYG